MADTVYFEYTFDAGDSWNEFTISASRWDGFWCSFDVSGYTSEITSATLRVYFEDGGSVNHEISASSEAGLNGSTAPTESDARNADGGGGTVLGSINTTSAGWVELDVTSYVEAQRQGDGEPVFRINPNTGGWADYEGSSTNRPHLVIEATPPEVYGNASNTLSGPTADGGGSVSVDGGLGPVGIASVSASGAGSLSVSGAVSAALGGLSTAADGTVSVTGFGSAVLTPAADPVVRVDISALEYHDLVCEDGLTGVSYIMWGGDLAARGINTYDQANYSTNFVAVRYVSGAWYYDNNSGFVLTFTPLPTDRIIGTYDHDAHTYELIYGQQEIEGIGAGILSSDIIVHPEYLYNHSNQTLSGNEGEFVVQGTFFTYPDTSAESPLTVSSEIRFNGVVATLDGFTTSAAGSVSVDGVLKPEKLLGADANLDGTYPSADDGFYYSQSFDVDSSKSIRVGLEFKAEKIDGLGTAKQYVGIKWNDAEGNNIPSNNGTYHYCLMLARTWWPADELGKWIRYEVDLAPAGVDGPVNKFLIPANAVTGQLVILHNYDSTPSRGDIDPYLIDAKNFSAYELDSPNLALEASAVGSVPLDGGIAATLSMFGLAADADLPVDGGLTATLPSFALAESDGEIRVEGGFAGTLLPPLGFSQGSVPVEGELVHNFPSLTFTARMIDAYPSVGIDWDSEADTIPDGEVYGTRGGKIYSVGYHDDSLYRFRVIHPYISQEEVDKLMAFWERKRREEFVFLWPMDESGVEHPYTCKFIGKKPTPKAESNSPEYNRLVVEMIGTRGA